MNFSKKTGWQNLNSKENLKYQWLCFKPTMYVIISLFVYLLLPLVILKNERIEKIFIKEATTPQELVMGCYKVGLAIGVVFFTGIGIVLFASIHAIRYVFWNRTIKNLAKFNIQKRIILISIQDATVGLVLVFIAFSCGLTYLYMKETNYFENMNTLAMEYKNIQEENFITEELYLKSEADNSAKLLFYSGSLNKVCSYKVGGIGSSVTKIYVPDYIPFAIDEAHPYLENSILNVNMEKAAVYKVTYTPNLNLVIDIETLPPQGAIENVHKSSDGLNVK